MGTTRISSMLSWLSPNQTSKKPNISLTLIEMRKSMQILGTWPTRAGSSHKVSSLHDCAYTEHRNGPRPVSCEINLRVTRLSSRTVHPTPVAAFYIESPVPKALYDCATPRLYEDGHRTYVCEHQRLHYGGGP